MIIHLLPRTTLFLELEQTDKDRQVGEISGVSSVSREEAFFLRFGLEKIDLVPPGRGLRCEV